MRSVLGSLAAVVPAALALVAAAAGCRTGGGVHAGGAGAGAPDRPAAHPFGAHLAPPPAGARIIFPGHHGRAELDAAVAGYYDRWKAEYLEPACAPGEYRVRSTPATKAHAVSEGHGYGMVAVALMAGHDAQARALFDGFFRYYRGHPTLTHKRLMAWAQNAACQNVGGSNSATDGDLDIAYALLLADAQWGSAGDIDYGREGRALLGAMLDAEVTPAGTLLVGDWVTDPRGKRYRSARGSDFIPQHFRAFARATGERRWQAVLDKTYALVGTLQARYAPVTGLLPDFVVEATGEAPQPAPPLFLEKTSDGQFSWNACRAPWRLATDYVVAGEPRAEAAVRRMNAWLRQATGGDPTRIANGYALGGAESADGFGSLAFVAPFMVAAMVEPETGTNQPWLNALWDEVTAREITEYYGDTIKLFALIVASGNWWSP